MKSGREHVVPLSPRALEILSGMPRDGVRVFPTAPRHGRRVPARAHGPARHHRARFSAAFSTWCAEATRIRAGGARGGAGAPIRDKTMAAYQRGALLQKRRILMDAWAKYCAAPTKPDSKVVALRA